MRPSAADDAAPWVPPDGRRLAAVTAAEGFAVGRAVRVVRRATSAQRPAGTSGITLREAVGQVGDDLRRLLSALPDAEMELFAPEARILEELGPRLLAREGAGRSLEDVVVAETSCGCTDLIIDLRVRLLDALEGSPRLEAQLGAVTGDAGVVLLAERITPSMVASLPVQVVAVIAALEPSATGRRDVGRTSHAAILATGRGLPLVYLAPDQLASVPDGAWVIVDAAGADAAVCVEPSAPLLAAATLRREADDRRRARDDGEREPLDHLGVELRVNVSSAQDEIPAAADGVGLVRTETMFAGRRTAPSESEQLAALLVLGAKARGRPIVVRLFDAGGDKPVPWLGEPSDPSRGIGRLLKHPEVLATQLRALARARERADVRVLLPFVRAADEVKAVRRVAGPTLQIGAMIESPDAVDAVDAIASAADFVSIGTNDLTATTLGLDRGADAPSSHPRVLALVGRTIAAAHARGRKVAVCGEMAGDPQGARVAVGLGADALSVAPARLALVRRELGRAVLERCRAEALATIDAGRRRPWCI